MNNFDDPVIIDTKGTYKTRGGLTVTIDQIGDPKYTFNCKGNIHRKSPSGKMKYEWNIWHPAGFFRALEPSDLDIVEKVT